MTFCLLSSSIVPEDKGRPLRRGKASQAPDVQARHGRATRLRPLPRLFTAAAFRGRPSGRASRSVCRTAGGVGAPVPRSYEGASRRTGPPPLRERACMSPTKPCARHFLGAASGSAGGFPAPRLFI